jgi:hypothetical protein
VEQRGADGLRNVWFRPSPIEVRLGSRRAMTTSIGFSFRFERLGADTGKAGIGGECLVGLHRVDPERDAPRPGAAELGGRDTAVKQQGSFRTRTRLRHDDFAGTRRYREP